TLPSPPTETTITPLPVTLDLLASYGYSIRGLKIIAALPVGAGPEGPGFVGRAIGATGLFEGVRFGGGVFFSSTNSGACSGTASGGGGGGGSSSGGGVGAGGSGA